VGEVKSLVQSLVHSEIQKREKTLIVAATVTAKRKRERDTSAADLAKKQKATDMLDKQLHEAAQAVYAASMGRNHRFGAAWVRKQIDPETNLLRWPLLTKTKANKLNIMIAEYRENDGAPAPEASALQGGQEALTTDEIRQLGAFIKNMAYKNNAPNRTLLRREIKRMLNHRREHLRKKTAGFEELNWNAQRILGCDAAMDDSSSDKSQCPSRHWFIRFYAVHGEELGIKEMKASQQDRKRAQACTRSTAREHMDRLKHGMMYLPKPRLDGEGDVVTDAAGKFINDNCDPLDAIINPTTGKYQSGDRELYARIAERREAVRQLQQQKRRALQSALQTFPATNGQRPDFPARTQESIDKIRVGCTNAEQELEAIEKEDQRRGRERVLGMDEMSQFINYDSSKGPLHEKCGCARGTQVLLLLLWSC